MVQMCHFFLSLFCCCSFHLPQPIYSLLDHTRESLMKKNSRTHTNLKRMKMKNHHHFNFESNICALIQFVHTHRMDSHWFCLSMSPSLPFYTQIVVTMKAKQLHMCCVIYRQCFVVADASLMNETKVPCTHTHKIFRTHSKKQQRVWRIDFKKQTRSIRIRSYVV